MIRLLVLNRRFETGGAERQLITLLKGLDKARFEIVVASFYDGGELLDEVRSIDGVRWLSLDKSSRWDVLSLLWRLRTLVRTVDPHIIHGYMGPSHLLSTLFGRWRGARVVWAVRASNMDLSEYGLFARFSFWLECRSARWADLIIANSAAGRDYVVARGFPRDRTVVVANGIDTARFRFDAAARDRLRTAWGVSDKTILLGVVARLDPMKDHRNFLVAAAQLLKQRDDLRFACIGDGPAAYRAALGALSHELGLDRALIWAGAHRDVTVVYSALDIAVSCSAYGEGFSNVVGEAMACGVPCVVTEVGDSARIVGATGEVAPPKDSDALAAAITRMLSRITSGEYADVALRKATIRQRIQRDFSIERLVLDTQRLLTEIVDVRPCHRSAGA